LTNIHNLQVNTHYLQLSEVVADRLCQRLISILHITTVMEAIVIQSSDDEPIVIDDEPIVIGNDEPIVIKDEPIVINDSPNDSIINNDQMTPEQVAQEILAQSDIIRSVEIPLLCGVIMPMISISIERDQSMIWLVVGDVSTGRVIVGFEVDEGVAQNGNIRSFFNQHRLTPNYRAAVAQQTMRSVSHLFMLLIDEIVCHILMARPNTGFEMSLQDMARVGSEETPFAIRGRMAFPVRRTSRFLEWVRGIGYYEPFGFWPIGHAPQEYLKQMRHFGGRHLGTNEGLVGFQQALASSRARPDPFDMLLKQYPPFLPPLRMEPVRRFTDIPEYMHVILASGDYGRSIIPVTIGFAGEKMDSDPPPPGDINAEFGPVGNRTLTCLGAWIIDTRLPGSVTIIGPVGSRFNELVASADAAGEPVDGQLELKWVVREWADDHTALVGGEQFSYCSPLGFTMRGADILMEAGFVPSRLRHSPERLGTLLDEARECDRIAGADFIGEADPRYQRCLPVTQLLMGDLWIRLASRKRRHKNNQ
jgi:hypothetical protein